GRVDEVVSDEAALGVRQPEPSEDLLVDAELLEDALVDLVHSELLATAQERFGLASRDDSGLQAGLLGQPDADAVLGIEHLRFVAAREEDDLPIRQDAVRVHQDQLHAPCALHQIMRLFQSYGSAVSLLRLEQLQAPEVVDLDESLEA